jgi:hypothetical protein
MFASLTLRRATGSLILAGALASALAANVLPASAAAEGTRFSLSLNPKFAACVAQNPSDPSRLPTAEARVEHGTLNDTLRLSLHNVRPHLAFDMFSVQRSSLRSDGSPDPAFKNFGLAWYQSDVQADDDGTAQVTVKTILLNQIFGFDPDVSLPPTNTFHVGLWFNDPNDAAACGFDVSHPTPFNCEHHAGPLAMISVPNAATNLGPLCTNPDTSVSPAVCNP